MKRALAIAVALCTIGVGAFGLGTFSGKWEGGITLLPTPTLTKNTLTINYTDFGLTFTGVLSLLGDTADTFTASVKGMFGPFSVSGKMNFDFDDPAYLGGELSTGFDFGGVGLSLLVNHYMAQQLPPCGDFPAGPNLKYTFTGTLAPFTVKAIFWDCCTGTFFYNLNVGLKGVGLCCGVTFDVVFDFLKTGFNYLQFSLKDFAAICCGISFDATIKFTIDQKIVTITPKFAGIGDACFTVFADIPTDAEYLPALEIYGWAIRCTLADCNYLEWVHAVDVTYLTAAGYTFVGDSNEYFKLGFCGAGCCGGQWKADLAVYFQSDTPGAGLFGIVALGFNLQLPIMSNLTVTVGFSNPPTTLTLGWTFTF